jgi:hypothetical protein
MTVVDDTMSPHLFMADQSPDASTPAVQATVASASAPAAASASTTGASGSVLPPSKNLEYYPDRDAFMNVSRFISLHPHPQHHDVTYY